MGATVPLVLVLVACGTTPAATSPTPLPRCADGRPQQEIDFALAKAGPFEPRSSAIACVLNAVSEPPSYDRSYRLTDGRQLHVYERTTALPAKAGQAPLATGTVAVGSLEWQFSVLDFPSPVLELHLERPDLYLELDLRMADREIDLALLRTIASEWRVR